MHPTPGEQVCVSARERDNPLKEDRDSDKFYILKGGRRHAETGEILSVIKSERAVIVG